MKQIFKKILETKKTHELTTILSFNDDGTEYILFSVYDDGFNLVHSINIYSFYTEKIKEYNMNCIIEILKSEKEANRVLNKSEK